jgi:hypothetical protein
MISPIAAQTYDYLWLRIIVSLAAIALLLGHSFYPRVRVDTAGVCLLVVAVIPWLSPIFESIEVAGLKLELREVKENLADATQRTDEAQSSANIALSKSLAANLRATTQLPVRAISEEEANAQVDRLLNKYVEIRARESAGPVRTLNFTNIVSDLVRVLPYAKPFDVQKALASGDEKDHLRAACFLWASPNADYLDALIKAAGDEKQPFIQYWLIEAIGKILGKDPTALTQERKANLLTLQDSVNDPRDQSRYAELSRIITSATSGVQF